MARPISESGRRDAHARVREPAMVERSTAVRLLGLVVMAAALTATGCAACGLAESAALVRRSEPLQQQPAAPRLSMLVVGDSTAVGTGASDARHSLAGLIAGGHPGLSIVNRARDGARFADVADTQLEGSGHHDIVLVLAGGNDVIRLRALDRMQADIDRVAARARAHGDLVVLMPAGNVGNAAFFFAPLSWWMSTRARRMHEMVRQAAARHDAVYVRLFEERAQDPFVLDRRLNASDGLHPSDAGYAAWFAALQSQAPTLMQRLQPAKAPAP